MKKYLQFYLDEYVFRFNLRKSNGRGKLLRRLTEQAIITPSITRNEFKANILPKITDKEI
ncbi:MAG: hypothetical protein LBG48_01590 [Rickettsiales bacterium]|jgi:hypothetical protein|nr:hypothetical protein [Rickettsiales bacterium]